MISILVGNTYLDLFADTQVSVNFSNDTFGSDGSSFVTYSENVEIPLTDTNAEVFQIDRGSKIIGRKFIIGEIIKDSKSIMTVTCEVQSVEIGCLEEKVSLLVMDAVSGIMKDLKKRKLDILFNNSLDYGYYFKVAAPHIKNPLYRFAFIDTNGYNANINPSESTKYTYLSKINDEAVPRMVFNVNECMNRIFGSYGLENRLSFGGDLFTTIPYNDLSGVKVSEKKTSYNQDFRVPILQRKAIGASNLNPTQEAMNKLVDKTMDLTQYYKAIEADYSGLYDVAKYINNDSSFNGFFVRYYSGFFNNGEYILKPENIKSLIGTKFKYSLHGSVLSKLDFMYTDLSEAQLFITVRKDPDSIYKQIPVAKLLIDVDCTIKDVIPTNDYLYSDRISIKCGEKVNVTYSIKFSGNGSFYQDNNETIRCELGILYAYKPIYLHLVINNNQAPVISLSPVEPDTIAETNSVLDTNKYYEDCFAAFNKLRYDEIIADMNKNIEQSVVDSNKRSIVSLPSSFKEAEITAYDFVSEFCKRFNKKIFISGGAVSDTESIVETITVIDELNSSIVITPKDFESEIKSIQIKNKAFNSAYDKLYNGNGAFDSEEIIINEDNDSKKVVQLKSCPIPESVVGDGYAVNDGISELLTKYGMVTTGVTQLKSVSSKEMDFRVCYIGGDMIYSSNTYPRLYGGAIYDSSGDKIDIEIGDDNNYILYTNPTKTLINTVASNVLKEREFTIPAVVYQNTNYTGEQVNVNLKAKFRCGFLVIDIPKRQSFSMLLKLMQVPELISDKWGRITGTMMKKSPIFNLNRISGVEDRYWVEKERDTVATIDSSGVEFDMKISVVGRKSFSGESRIYIPLATSGMLVQNIFAENNITKTYPALLAFNGEEVFGECNIQVMKSYNNNESLSFNKLTANGKTTALEKYFAESISAVNASESPYLELEIKVDTSIAKKILSGSKIDLRGDLYQIIEASDINMGESSIVKLKLSK